MDNNVQSKLILAKKFYDRAMEQSQIDNSISRMVAVHHFHIAIEITLRNLVSKYGIENYKDNCGFSDLIGIIKNSTTFKSNSLKIPHESKIKTINVRRNDIQHNFIEPSADSTVQTGLDTCRFLADTFDMHFDIDFNELSEISLLESPLLRKYLTYAEKHHEKKSYVESYRCCSAAFEWAKMYLKRPNDGSEEFNTFTDFLNVSENEGLHRSTVDLLERIANQTNRNTEKLALLSSGIDIYEYSEFTEFRPYVSLMMDGNVHFGMDRREPGEIQARAAINFVLRTLLQWQVGSSPDFFDKYTEGSEMFFNQQDWLLEDHEYT